jgi:16S rRNA (cytosine1402-N4)-methyltransferase
MTMPALVLDEPPAYSHVTVMAQEVVTALSPLDGKRILDVTLGGGGHSAALLSASPSSRILAFDRDPAALEAARERLAAQGDRARLVRGSFLDLEESFAENGFEPVDGLIADLGVSSAQLDNPGRGMSFRAEGPLDMRMDPENGETAEELIARLSQEELANVIYELGEEKRSRRIASCIKQAQRMGALETTMDLRKAVVKAVGPRRVGGIDPATRTFQALRIAVNRELEQLSRLLEAAPRLLKPGGIAVFISFHSLEDRLVKRAFMDREKWLKLTPKPLVAGDTEQRENPRARSAKLRAAVRI